MIVKNRIATLELLADATDDPSLAAAARRKRSELLVELALVGPTAEDHAEELRLAEEARLAEEKARLDALHARDHARMQGRILTQPGS
jgi:hypothetical protein